MSSEDRFDGMEEMDDFTVGGAPDEAVGPGDVPDEDITGAAHFERPIDAAEDAEGDEPTLRPQTLDDFVGQEALKENLRIFVEAAKRRKEPLDHMLLAGPPGLGRPRCAGSSRARWGSAYSSRAGRASSGRGTWRPS